MIHAFDGHPDPLRVMFTNAVLDFLPVCPKHVQISNQSILKLIARFYEFSACQLPRQYDAVPYELAWLTLEGIVYDLQREFYYTILRHVSINSTRFLGIVGIQADMCTPLEDLYLMLVTSKIWHPFPAHAFKDCDKQQVVIPSTHFTEWNRALKLRSLTSSRSMMILIHQLTTVEGCCGSVDGPLEDWPGVHHLVLRRLDAVAVEKLLSAEEQAVLHMKMHRDVLYCSGGRPIIVKQLAQASDSPGPTAGGPSARPFTSNITLTQILRKRALTVDLEAGGNVLKHKFIITLASYGLCVLA